MYYCNDCEDSFSEPNCSSSYNYDTDNRACAETFTAKCPYCGSEDIEEAYQCENCDNYYPTDKLHEDFCEDCLKNITDKLDMNEIIKLSKSEIKVSDFILKVLGESQINNILSNAIRETLSTIPLTQMKEKYFENDYELMAEFVKEYNKN